MSVGSAGRPSAGDQPSLSISGFTWERARRGLSVARILCMTRAICPLERGVAGPSATAQNLFSSGQLEVVKSPRDVMSVGKLSAPPHNLWTTRKFKLGRNPVNAQNVVKLVVECHPILNTM